MQEDSEKLVTTKDLGAAVSDLKTEFKAELKAEVTVLNQRMDRIEEKLTKTDQTVERMAIRIVQMEQKMETLETKADAQRRHDIVMNAFDKMMKRYDIYDSERAASELTFRQHEAKIEDHEKRLVALEQKV